MTNEAIYLLFSCDEWKSWASMNLVVATQNPLKFKKVLKTEVDCRNMEIDEQEVLTLPIEEIDRRLTYGFINIVRDGEVQ